MTKACSLQPHKLLVCRTDALGDAILALPVCMALKRAWPRARVDLLVSSYAFGLLAGQPGPDGVLSYDVREEHAQQRGFRRLVEQLMVEKYDAGLVAFPEARIAWAVYQAGIPCRVGTGRRLWSLLFTLRVPHQRSLAQRHEADYNLDLVRALGVEARLEAPRLQLTPEGLAWAREFYRGLGLKGKDRLVVIHPGSRESAANWPVPAYAALAQELGRQKFKVLLTGSQVEQGLLAQVASACSPAPWVLDQAIDLKQLAALISRAGVFISGSTGPMHMAAGLGVPTVSFFPPAGVTGPVRWQPLGNAHKILTPPQKGKSWDMADIPQVAAMAAVEEMMKIKGVIK